MVHHHVAIADYPWVIRCPGTRNVREIHASHKVVVVMVSRHRRRVLVVAVRSLVAIAQWINSLVAPKRIGLWQARHWIGETVALGGKRWRR